MTQVLAKIPRSFVKSVFCLLLAFGCLLGFAGNAFAVGELDGTWQLQIANIPNGQVISSPDPRERFEINFLGNEFRGIAGTAPYFGAYQTRSQNPDGGEISLRGIKSSLDPRNIDPRNIDPANSYLNGLRTVNQYRILGSDFLSLRGQGGDFIFRRR